MALSVDNREGNPPANDALHVLDLRSGTLRRIGHDEFAYVTSQCWSPDGKEIVYTLNKPGVQTIRIYSMQQGTSRDIASGPSSHNATWSPDGRWIAYSVYRPSATEDCAYFLIRPSGQEQRVLFRTDIIYRELVWSPDSRFVAYAGYAPGSDELRLWVRRLEDGAEDWFASLSETDVLSFQWVQSRDLLKH